MIIFMYLILFCFFELVTYFKFSTIIKLNTIYNSVWCLGAIATEINYAGLYSVSGRTHSFIVISLIIFNMIYLLYSENLKSVDTKPNFENLKNTIQKSDIKIIYWTNFVSYIFMFPIFIKAVKIIMTQGFSALRTYAYVESDLLASLFQLRIVAWFIYPVFVVTILIAVIFIVMNVNNKLLSVLAFINIVIYITSFGGRGFIVISIMYFLFALMISLSLKKSKFHIKFKYKLVGTLTGGGLYYLISLRLLKGLNVIENTMIYLFGSITYFDVISKNIIEEDYLYGRGVLGIVINPILYVYSSMTSSANLTSEFIIKQTTDTFYFISDSYRFNALPTMLYVFILDGGLWGIIIGIVLFSLFVTFIEKRFYKNPTMIGYMIYIYSAYAVFNSVIIYDFYTIKSFFILVFIFIFGKFIDKNIKK